MKPHLPLKRSSRGIEKRQAGNIEAFIPGGQPQISGIRAPLHRETASQSAAADAAGRRIPEAAGAAAAAAYERRPRAGPASKPRAAAAEAPEGGASHSRRWRLPVALQRSPGGWWPALARHHAWAGSRCCLWHRWPVHHAGGHVTAQRRRHPQATPCQGCRWRPNAPADARTSQQSHAPTPADQDIPARREGNRDGPGAQWSRRSRRQPHHAPPSLVDMPDSPTVRGAGGHNTTPPRAPGTSALTMLLPAGAHYGRCDTADVTYRTRRSTGRQLYTDVPRPRQRLTLRRRNMPLAVWLRMLTER